jgi:hypothetical protein
VIGGSLEVRTADGRTDKKAGSRGVVNGKPPGWRFTCSVVEKLFPKPSCRSRTRSQPCGGFFRSNHHAHGHRQH